MAGRAEAGRDSRVEPPRQGRDATPTARLSAGGTVPRAPTAGPRTRESRPSDFVVAPAAESEPAADDELDGAMGPAGLNGRGAPHTTVIPPREHSERERLAMRPEIRGELGPLIDDLHDLFEREIAFAKQSASARCGICYLHFPTAEMDYRDADGFYICQACEQAMRGRSLRMIRRQPRTGG